MRVIRIISDGVSMDVYDDDHKKSLEEVSKELRKMMTSDTVITLIGTNSSILVRPSSISGINVFDSIEIATLMKKQIQQPELHEKVEQNIDMIVDSE